MIPEGLAGKRIAVTGGTGFLGTALVERLLRCVPGCELVLLIRPGPVAPPSSSEPSGRSSATTPSTGCARSSARTASPPWWPSGSRPSPATSAPTAWRSTTTGGRTGVVRHRDPLGGHRLVRLAARRRRRGQPARPHPHRRDAGRARRHPAPRVGVHLLRGRQPAGAAPEIPVHDSPFFIDVDWRSEVDGARRPAPTPRPRAARPDALVRFRKEARGELGAAGTPALAAKTEQRRGAWVKEQMVEAGRARAAVARLARRLRLHQGPRRAGAAAEPRRRARVDRAPVDHRVGAGRADPGLDPRLPHGRAGDHLLRPRPAEGVPRRARGHRRRHPRRPRGGRHHRRRRRPGARRARHHPGGLRLGEPAALPAPRRPGADLLHRPPDLRRRGPAHHRARVVVPGPGPGAAPARAGQGRHREG